MITTRKAEHVSPDGVETAEVPFPHPWERAMWNNRVFSFVGMVAGVAVYLEDLTFERACTFGIGLEPHR